MKERLINFAFGFCLVMALGFAAWLAIWGSGYAEVLVNDFTQFTSAL